MKRLCQICNLPLHGKQRKYCNKCKYKAHLKQMNDNYKNNKDEWLSKDGKYIRDNQRCLGRVLGEDHWNYGKHLSDETKEKCRIAKLGEKSPMFGKHHSDETKEKQSIIKIGDKNPNWQGGIAYDRSHVLPEYACTKLNKRFEGSEGHHILSGVIVYIPKYIHRSIYHNMKSGQNIKEINKLAINYLLGNINDNKY